MPVVNRIAGYADEMKAWRRHIHQHPELGFDCHQTAAFVVERLREFGVDEIHEGIAESGVVALIHGASEGPVVGLRADMDALPIEEETGAEHSSTVPGKMHACGHDGHTTMLLGAAKYLAETRRFAGTVALIFQPAEEGGGGGQVMCQEGMMDRFNIARVFGLHNAPGVPTGHIVTRAGPTMAAVDEFEFKISGVGGHAAEPHTSKDPVVAAVGVAGACQTIVSRNHNPMQELVVSVTNIQAGKAYNVIPATALVAGTVRSFDRDVRAMVKARLEQIAAGMAQSYDVEIELNWIEGYPPTVNDPAEVAFAAEVAREVVGEEAVDDNAVPIMAAEDFSYMLEERPGAYLMVGQGDTATCHHPAYDFNDEIAPVGASLFARLVEKALPVA